MDHTPPLYQPDISLIYQADTVVVRNPKQAALEAQEPACATRADDRPGGGNDQLTENVLGARISRASSASSFPPPLRAGFGKGDLKSDLDSELSSGADEPDEVDEASSNPGPSPNPSTRSSPRGSPSPTRNPNPNPNPISRRAAAARRRRRRRGQP